MDLTLLLIGLAAFQIGVALSVRRLSRALDLQHDYSKRCHDMAFSLIGDVRNEAHARMDGLNAVNNRLWKEIKIVRN